MSKLTKYNSFKSLKSGNNPNANAGVNRAAQVSALEAFFRLLRQNKNNARKAKNG